MPMYNRLRYKLSDTASQLRCIRGLKRLRADLDTHVPRRDTDDTLMLATWNIRDFDANQRWGNGPRLPETLFYIAEILSRFDFVAVQEVNDLGEWEQVMDILGNDYDYIASDVTHQSLGGNGERLLFLFDKRKVSFQRIAGEVVLPRSMLVTASREGGSTALLEGKQFRRTPYIGKFQAGWFKFAVCAVHIYFGEESGSKLEERRQEIAQIAEFFSEKSDVTFREEGRSLILLGDFNIVHPEHDTMTALLSNGFTVPAALRVPTNIDRTNYYDQIAFKSDQPTLDFIEGQGADGLPNAGAFQLFQSVMRDDDAAEYLADAARADNGAGLNDAELRAYYAKWRSYQISDHAPLWARVGINSSASYLDWLEGSLAPSG